MRALIRYIRSSWGTTSQVTQPLASVDPHREALLASLGLVEGAVVPYKGAGIAQLAERELPKLEVAGSNPVARSSLH